MEKVDDPLQLVLGADRDMHGHALVGQLLSQPLQHAEEIGPLAVEPDSTVPSRFAAPVWNSSASTREVLPVPRCPTTATFRIFPGSNAMPQLPFAVRFAPAIVAGPGGKLRLERGSCGAGEPGLQAEDRLRVQLGNTRLGDAEHLAD